MSVLCEFYDFTFVCYLGIAIESECLCLNFIDAILMELHGFRELTTLWQRLVA